MINKINEETIEKIKMKTPYSHTARPYEEGMNEEQIKGLFYKALTDENTSVIAEINRIVQEINNDKKRCYPPDSIGKIEILQFDKFKQPKGLVTDYALFLFSTPELTTKGILNEITDYRYPSLNENDRHLILKISTPHGVVPNDNFSFAQGGTGYGGLGLLTSSSSESYDGNYYLKVPIICKEPIEVLYFNWNGDAYTTYLIVDINALVGNSTVPTEGIKLYKKYSVGDKEGEIYDYIQSDSQYVGLYIGSSPSSKRSDYTWIPLTKVISSGSSSGETSSGGASSSRAFKKESIILPYQNWKDNVMDVRVDGVTTDNVVFVAPNPAYMSIWTNHGVYCSVQYENHLKFYTDTPPEKDIEVNILIGDGI